MVLGRIGKGQEGVLWFGTELSLFTLVDSGGLRSSDCLKANPQKASGVLPQKGF